MEEKNIGNLLADEIQSQILGLKTLTPGTDEHINAVDNLTKLYKLRIEETKNEWEYSERFERQKAQADDQVKDRYIRLGVDVAGIVLPLVLQIWFLNKGFKFEETGSYTSTTFRGILPKWRSK